MVAGYLVVGIGHQCHLCGFHLKHQINILADGVSLDVELCGDDGADIPHILISDVSLIGAWMHGNTLCTKFFAVYCHLQDIGIVASSGIAHRGHFIDINA